MQPPFHLPGQPRWVSDFAGFIARGNVVDLAVGIVVGAAFTGIVNSLVKDLLTPIIGLLVGGIDFSNVFVTLKGPHAATLADAQRQGAVTLNVGLFLNALIQFAIISFAVFWLVRLLGRLHLHQAASAVPTRTEALLAEIRDLLRTPDGEEKEKG